LLGRADDTLNVAGQRIGTREIEEVLRADPAIADVAVVGIADALRGQIPVAFAILAQDRGQSSDGSPLNDAQLTGRLGASVRAALGKAARPRRIFFVTGFPRTRSGKVMRRLIQDVFAGKPCAELQMVDDTTPLAALRKLSGALLTCSAEASDAGRGVPIDIPSEISA
jgi:propionyl-CoA synthetase